MTLTSNCVSRKYSAAPNYTKPVPTFFATVRVIEPFSTAVGLPIATETRPTVGGTGGLFISDPHYPGELFLLTARHVVMRAKNGDNELVEYTNHSQPHRNVLLFSDYATEKHLAVIKSEIGGKEIIIKQLEERLKAARQMEPAYAKAETDEVEPLLKKRTTLSKTSRCSSRTPPATGRTVRIDSSFCLPPSLPTSGTVGLLKIGSSSRLTRPRSTRPTSS
jgi:hypothetical protein